MHLLFKDHTARTDMTHGIVCWEKFIKRIRHVMFQTKLSVTATVTISDKKTKTKNDSKRLCLLINNMVKDSIMRLTQNCCHKLIIFTLKPPEEINQKYPNNKHSIVKHSRTPTSQSLAHHYY